MSLLSKVRLCSIFALLSVGVAHASLCSENEKIHAEAEYAKQSILELLDYRIYAIGAVNELRQQVAAGNPLRADQLEPFHQNVIARSQIQEGLLKQIEPYLDLANHPEKVHTDEDLFHYLIILATGYTLTDNYQDFVETLQKNSLLRHIANEANTSYEKPKNLLRRTVRRFYSVKFHRPTLRGARRFDELPVDLDQKLLEDDDLRFFWTIINSSATFKFLRHQNGLERVVYDIGFFFHKLFGAKKIFKDALHNSLEKTVEGLSQVFGNTIGLVQFRHGYLYHSESIENDLLAKLQPGDILLEKTPFRLTDRFIPGYWGHNAIWLGTEEDLKALGIWDDPKIQAIQGRIHDQKSILEALRPGVTTNRLEHFLDIDSFAILRRPKMSPEEQRQVILRAASQYGKPYDFGFDVETQDKLVCSELIFMTYTDVPFRLEKALGRYTINPDSIAESAVAGTFDIIALISSGNPAQGDLKTAMQSLLNNGKAK